MYSETDSATSDDEERRILISIDIPDHKIDEAVDHMELLCPIQNIQSTSLIKQTFDIDHKNSFLAFDASIRDSAIDHFLQREIDYKYYMATGVIKDHQFLHKGNTIS